ncbi:MAG: TonB-dependent receptor plug domain-containing protein, partial [Opitutaceae bacterium]
MICATVHAAESAKRRFDLPAEDAVVSLEIFAKQSGQEIVYSPDVVRGTRTNAVKGEFSPKDAVDRMLADTALTASQTRSGLLSVKRAEAPDVETPAQATPDVRPNQAGETASFDENDTIEMSPFEVSSTSDEGYAARETLAGTRFRTDLKDLPSQVSVMTAEFLQDIATADINDAFRYSINVENQGEFQAHLNGDFQGGVVNITGGAGTRVRGLNQPGRTHDFFQTFVPGHIYNTERITFSSGPNSILFGNGNPSGTVDTSFKRARLQRPRYSLTLRADNHGSLQTSLDINQPIIKDKAAIRIAGLKSDEKSWRDPAGEDAERIYGSITVKPLPSTTIRGWYENANINRISTRNTRVGDSVTPWIEAGRPLFDNSFASPMPSPTTNNPVFSRNTVRTNVLLFGATATADSPLLRWGSTGSSTGAGQPVYSVVTKGPGAAPYQTGTDSYNYSLLDTSISPNDVSVNGTGTRNDLDSEIKGFTIEQRVGQKLFLEFSYNSESLINPNTDMVRGNLMRIVADAN